MLTRYSVYVWVGVRVIAAYIYVGSLHELSAAAASVFIASDNPEAWMTMKCTKLGSNLMHLINNTEENLMAAVCWLGLRGHTKTGQDGACCELLGQKMMISVVLFVGWALADIHLSSRFQPSPLSSFVLFKGYTSLIFVICGSRSLNRANCSPLASQETLFWKIREAKTGAQHFTFPENSRKNQHLNINQTLSCAH